MLVSRNSALTVLISRANCDALRTRPGIVVSVLIRSISSSSSRSSSLMRLGTDRKIRVDVSQGMLPYLAAFEAAMTRAFLTMRPPISWPMKTIGRDF